MGASTGRFDRRALTRGLARRCPRCGARGLFRSFFELHDRCPGCGLRFEREEGYWLGAMVVALALVEGAFGVLLVGGIALTWPHVPWNALLVAGLVMNAVLPVVLYPVCKTVWLGVDLFFNPATVTEEAEGIAARDPDAPGGRARPTGNGR